MFNNVKVMRRITALLLASVLVFGFASCNFDDDNDKKSPAPAAVTYGTASYSDFYGAWENNDGGWHSEYVVSSTMIKDNGMGVYFDVKEVAGVESKYGYTLVFCQVAEGHGTAYTPAGNFYALALKLSDGKLSICCPLDYAQNFTTLDALKAYYPATCDIKIGTSNFVTLCTVLEPSDPSVTVSDEYGTTVSFKADNVSCTMAGVGGSSEVASFTPVRDTSKETGDVLFYVYSSADRSLVADLLYIAVKKSGDKNVVYLYVYDEDEEENTYEPLYPDFMPEMTDEQLAQLNTLIPGTSE